MSESNISPPSQESVSDNVKSQPTQESLSSVSESEKTENVKPPASKIAKPTGLKLPTTAAPVTRIGRLCNSTPKPAVPSNVVGNYSNSLKQTYVKTFTDGLHNGWYDPHVRNKFGERVSLKYIGERVSLKDIGVRQPVVHFDLDYQHQYRNGTGVGRGTTMSTSSIRRISDELARRRLTDVDETDENSYPYYGSREWAYDRKMSSGSVLSDSSRKSDELRRKRASDASMSADSYSDYWKSDFEPRRASDASVVLTEDTDQFIIGDRVWVGGVKPGQIAYIGETQFAPGEWAGVVLDEPIGKNDGTVANIRYFQCEPKKGIFSRLTRLTRYPLIDGGAGEPAATRPLPSELRKSNGSLPTSVPKKSSALTTSATSLKNSVPKAPSPDSSLHPNIQVGDRVIVKSSQGSKAGILRYLGPTDFAAGEWCGVELDDPLGKNDGSVSGTRYFECRPKFGLFAPLHKISKSPVKRPSAGNCVIHNRSGATTPGMRRQGSKESLVSMSSTASTTASVRSTSRKIGVRTPTTPTSAKNALQETLKEKELHIEQLLKERDLERAEVTRAANQADEAEKKLAAFKQELEQHKDEAEARVSDLDALVCLLRAENKELKNLLDDEKKRYEDLQFRFEEETIDKADIKSMSMKYEEKIKILENTLFEERKRTEALEQDSNKLFEAEEQLVMLKEELDVAKEENNELRKTQSTLEQENISVEAHLTSARAEIESLKIENESLKSSASQDQNNLRENLAKFMQAFEECKKQLENKQLESEQLSREIETRDKNFAEREKDIHSKYLKIINDVTGKHKSETGNLEKQLQDLKNSSETKLKYLENQVEEKMKLCNSLENKLNEVNILLSRAAAEKSVEQSKQKETEEKLQKEVKHLAEELQKKTELLKEEISKSEAVATEKQKLEYEAAEAKKSFSLTCESTDRQVIALNGIIDKQREELEKMKAEVDSKSKECESLAGALGSLKKELEDRQQEVDKKFVEKTTEVEKLREELEKTKDEFGSKNEELKNLYESQEESFISKITALENVETEKNKEIESLTRELDNVKNSLAVRESDLETEQDNNKNLVLKLTALEKNYRKISEEKDQVELAAGDTNRKLQSVEEKLAQVIARKTKLEADISSFINSSNDSSIQLTKLNEDLRAKEREMDALREELSRNTHTFERTEQELRQILEKQDAELVATKLEVENLKEGHIKEVDGLKKKLEECAGDAKQAEDEWKKKLEAVSSHSDTRVGNLENKIREMEKMKMEERNRLEEHVKRLVESQDELRIKLKAAEDSSTESKSALEKQIENLKAENITLLERMEKTKSDLSNSEEKLISREKDVEVYASESEKLRNELKETAGKLASTINELAKAKDEKNKLNKEKSRLEKTAAAVEELLKEAQVKNTELEVNASSVESENKLLKDTINQLREEKCLLDKDSTDKMMLLTELRSQMEASDYSRKTQEAETEVKIRNLEEESAELRSKLQKTEMSYSAENSEKVKQIEELRKEINRLKQESSQIVSGKEKDIENVNVMVNQLRKELEDKKLESEKKSDLIKKTEKQFQQAKEELEAERRKNEEYGKRLSASETERIDLKERFEEQSKVLSNNTDVSGKLAEVSQKLSEAEKREQELMNNSKLERDTLEKMLETTNSLLSQGESERKSLSDELNELKQEKANLLSSNKILAESLEKEKKKMQEYKQTAEKVQNANAEDSSQRELQEEREFQKGQVDFLNSVIVDMQKKNDALKARIEILEMGFSPEDVDDFDLCNITTRSVAPRLFCDICDRFDLHDTEDCPTQANEDMPPPKSSKKAPPPERPYCEICEVFGHDSANCDDAETF